MGGGASTLFDRGKQPSRPVNERGVSLAFLLEFSKDISPNYSTYDVVIKVVQPFSAEGGGAFVDKIPEEHVGKPNFFVSHVWTEPFHHMVEQLKKHFGCTESSNAPQGVFLWIDIFAITQHANARHEKDRATWQTALTTAGRTLLCLDREGQTLQRLWCLYETWRTVRSRANSSGPSLTILGYDIDVKAVETAFNFFTLDKAKTSFPYDREVLLKQITGNGGRNRFDSDIREAWVQSCLTELEEWQQQKEQQPALAASQLVRLSKLLFVCEAYEQAVEAARAAVEVCENVRYKVGLRNWTGINANRTLGICLTQLGEYEEAETYLRRSLINSEGVYGKEHLETADSAEYLGTLLAYLQLHHEAELYHRRSLGLREKLEGSRHPTVILSYLNLATALEAQDKLEEALVLLDKAMHLCLKTVGRRHINTALCLHAQAAMHLREGHLVTAEALFEKAYEIGKECLGSEHIWTLDVMANIARCQMGLDKMRQAEDMWRAVVEGRRQALSATNVDTLASLMELAAVMVLRHKRTEAVQLLQDTLITVRQDLGDHDPSTLAVLEALEELGCHMELPPVAEQEDFGPLSPAELECSAGPSPNTSLTAQQGAQAAAASGISTSANGRVAPSPPSASAAAAAGGGATAPSPFRPASRERPGSQHSGISKAWTDPTDARRNTMVQAMESLLQASMAAGNKGTSEPGVTTAVTEFVAPDGSPNASPQRAPRPSGGDSDGGYHIGITITSSGTGPSYFSPGRQRAITEPGQVPRWGETMGMLRVHGTPHGQGQGLSPTGAGAGPLTNTSGASQAQANSPSPRPWDAGVNINLNAALHRVSAASGLGLTPTGPLAHHPVTGTVRHPVTGVTHRPGTGQVVPLPAISRVVEENKKVYTGTSRRLATGPGGQARWLNPGVPPRKAADKAALLLSVASAANRVAGANHDATRHFMSALQAERGSERGAAAGRRGGAGQRAGQGSGRMPPLGGAGAASGSCRPLVNDPLLNHILEEP